MSEIPLHVELLEQLTGPVNGHGPIVPAAPETYRYLQKSGLGRSARCGQISAASRRTRPRHPRHDVLQQRQQMAAQSAGGHAAPLPVSLIRRDIRLIAKFTGS